MSVLIGRCVVEGKEEERGGYVPVRIQARLQTPVVAPFSSSTATCSGPCYLLLFVPYYLLPRIQCCFSLVVHYVHCSLTVRR